MKTKTSSFELRAAALDSFIARFAALARPDLAAIFAAGERLNDEMMPSAAELERSFVAFARAQPTLADWGDSLNAISALRQKADQRR